MIQRIQSVFLLLSGLCLGGSLGLPFADSASPIPGTLFADGLFTATDNVLLLVLLALGAVAAVAAIFLFRNRKLQKNISWASIICTIGAVAFGVFYFMQQGQAMGATVIDEEPGAALPLIAVVFSLLAIRSITKDDKLVRSADRLR